MKTNAKKITFAAAATALSVVILYLGALLSVIDLVTVLIASLIAYIVLLQVGGAYPYMVYVGTSLLAFLFFFTMNPILPLAYTLLGGIYPLIHARLRRLVLPLRLTVKLLWANAVAVGIYLLSLYVFMLDTVAVAPWLLVAGLLVYNATFLLYDAVIGRFTRLYFYKIEPVLRRLMK